MDNLKDMAEKHCSEQGGKISDKAKETMNDFKNNDSLKDAKENFKSAEDKAHKYVNN